MTVKIHTAGLGVLTQFNNTSVPFKRVSLKIFFFYSHLCFIPQAVILHTLRYVLDFQYPSILPEEPVRLLIALNTRTWLSVCRMGDLDSPLTKSS